MKLLCILLSIFVAGCATCNVPLGNYSSSTGSEYEFSMGLTEKEYSLKHQSWSPGNYESKITSVTSGAWSCSGSEIKFSSDGVLHTATYQMIGANPFGLSVYTKALVFEASEGGVLSLEILYPASVFN